MACENCGGKDFTAVPTERLYELREDIKALGWGFVGLWAFALLVVLALVRKGVIGWADLVTTGG